MRLLGICLLCFTLPCLFVLPLCACVCMYCQSRLLLWRLAIVCTALLLLTCLPTEAAKQNTQKQVNAAGAGGYTAAAAAAAATAPSSNAAGPSSSAATPPVDAASAEALRRKQELQRKREEKLSAARAAALEKAQHRNRMLRNQRIAKDKRVATSAMAAKAKAEALIAKKRAADTPEVRAKGHSKLRWLLKETSRSSSRILQFTTEQYHQYVSEGPRPYYLLLQYTALSPQYNCPYCHMANQAIIPVAQAHFPRMQEKTQKVLQSNSTADIEESELPVFFANVDMGRCSDLFKELKFTSAPYMVLAPPRLATTRLKPMEFLAKLEQKYRFNLQASMKPEDFTSFVNKLAGIHVQLDAVKPGFMDLLVPLLVLAGLAVIGFKFGAQILMVLREFKQARFCMLLIGCGVYCWCISGGMYNVSGRREKADNHQMRRTRRVKQKAHADLCVCLCVLCTSLLG